MEFDKKGAQGSSRAETAEIATLGELDAGEQRVRHSLVDVLMPATPPAPTNARVIRLFGQEVGQSDARPLAEPTPVKPSAQQQKRDAPKVARNQSLFTAAGLRQLGGTDVKSGA